MDLAGDVDAEQLRRMLDARHPGTGRKVGRGFGDKSARGFDATFSAPKSVSVLWALSPDPWVRAEVLAAHDAAVTAALGWLEQHGAVTRRGKDGVDQVDTRGLVVALFRQHTSRSVDPQLHTHALIWSKVQDPSGRWLALDARWLKYQQRSIGWVYDAALRAELAARLGVGWDPVVEGHADLLRVPSPVREVFSQRSAEVEARLGEYLRRWTDEHDGDEPDRRTVARLQRLAVLDSRPPKLPGRDASSMCAEWNERAAAVGFDPRALSATKLRQASGPVRWDREVVIQEAISCVTADSATWLRADLGREIATLVPADATDTAGDLVSLVDDLTDDAASRCIELHPGASPGVGRRRDGRPVTEHVVDRRLTTVPVLDQEHALLTWARSATDATASTPTLVGASSLDHGQADAARRVAGTARLVLVVGPAGTGKTTALASAVETLRTHGRPVLGLAPSGKAADVLARETGCPAITLAKLLHGGLGPHDVPPRGTTVILDEAGMASTADLDRLVALADRHEWRLACVGDPHQLPAVGRGGIFADWCNALPTSRLEEVRRFAEPWEADASLGLRAGEPDAVEAYAAHRRLDSTHPALVADRVARQHARLSTVPPWPSPSPAPRRRARSTRQSSTATATGSTARPSASTMEPRYGSATALRRAATTGSSSPHRAPRCGTAKHGRSPPSRPTAGLSFTILTTAPSHSRRATWLATSNWAGPSPGTANQGITVDHGICVVEATSSRAGFYVGMTRGRVSNVAWVVDATGTADPVDTLTALIRRPERGITAHAMRDQLHGHPRSSVDDDSLRMRAQLDRIARRSVAARKPPRL